LPTHPWNDIDLIRANLRVFGFLRRGAKLAKPNPSGYFQTSRNFLGRDADDSITSLAPLIKNFLKRAILVAECEGPHGETSHLLRTARAGFENLRDTYRSAFLPRKTDQQNAVTGLITYLQSGPVDARKWLDDKALDTFNEVRGIYAAGDKSSNKRYQVKASGKYTTQDVPAVDSKKKISLTDREAIREKASIGLSRDRDTLSAEEVSRSSPKQIKTQIYSLRDKIRQIVHMTIHVDMFYETLSSPQRQLVRDTLKAQGGDRLATLMTALANMNTLMRAYEIKKQGSQYVFHDRWTATAGNCHELATLACLSLEREHVPFVSLVCLSDDKDVNGHHGDHVFAVVGLQFVGQNGFTKPNSTPVVVTPAARRAYLGYAHVIDPWAKLHCSVAEYPKKFREKMAEWSMQGKQIGVGGAWIDPDPATNDWYARTIDELNWEILSYSGYDNRVAP
jgi:hypothetical protein